MRARRRRRRRGRHPRGVRGGPPRIALGGPAEHGGSTEASRSSTGGACSRSCRSPGRATSFGSPSDRPPGCGGTGISSAKRIGPLPARPPLSAGRVFERRATAPSASGRRACHRSADDAPGRGPSNEPAASVGLRGSVAHPRHASVARKRPRAGKRPGEARHPSSRPRGRAVHLELAELEGGRGLAPPPETSTRWCRGSSRSTFRREARPRVADPRPGARRAAQNQSRAARSLGMSEGTFRSRMKRLGLKS